MMKNVYRKLALFGEKMLLPFLLIVSFVFAMFQGGFLSWFLFYGFLPFALYPILLFFYPLKNIQVNRVVKQREYKAGDEIHMEVTIHRNNRFPLLFLMIEDMLPSALLKQNDSNKRLVFLMFRKKYTYTYTIPQAVRGEHHFRTFTLMTGDLLGFYMKKYEVDCLHTILVYPEYKRISNEQFASLFEQGMHSSIVKKQEVMSIVSGVRQYIPGDRLTSIHWKATARKNEMMTKDFEVRKSQDVCMVLDQSPSVLFEELVRLAASLLAAALSKGISVSFAGSHQSLESSIFGRGEGQRRKLLYELAKIQEADEYHKGSLSAGLRKNGNTVYVMVTSQLQEEMIASLSTLRGKNAVTIFLLIKDDMLVGNQDKLLTEAERRGVSCRVLAPDIWTNLIKEGTS